MGFGAFAGAGWEEEGVGLPGRSEVVVLQPAGEFHPLLGDAGGVIDRGFEGANLRGVVAGGVDWPFDDDALESLATEGGMDDLAGCDLTIGGDGIGEGEEGGAASVDGDAHVAGAALNHSIAGLGFGRRHDGAIIRTIVRLWVRNGEERPSNA